MYYTIFCCFCQEVLKNFFGGYLISIGRNKTQTKNRYKLAYLSCLLKKKVEVTKSFLVVRTLICFQKASLLFPDFQTMSTNHNGWCKMSESNCSSCSQNKGATITLHPAYYTPRVGIEPTTPD